MENNISFSAAIDLMKTGHTCSRTGWNGDNQSVKLANAVSPLTLPFLTFTTVTGDVVPYSPSQTDILALDWYDTGAPVITQS